MYEQLQQQARALSHAYVLAGNVEENRKQLERFLVEDMGQDLQSNANVFPRTYDRLGIDEVRALGNLQSKTSLGKEGNKIFIIACTDITVEAQNAMLKIIEEPTEGTLWFFLMPNHRALLPTIISRVQLLVEEKADAEYEQAAVAFCAGSLSERNKLMEPYVGNSKKNVAPDRSGTALLLGYIMRHLLEEKNKVAEWSAIYRELEELASYATDRSSSVKHILEYVALRLPRC